MRTLVRIKRVVGCSEQIASAESAAVKEVRDTAATVAIAAAREVVAEQTDAAKAKQMIDSSITEVGAKLH